MKSRDSCSKSETNSCSASSNGILTVLAHFSIVATTSAGMYGKFSFIDIFNSCLDLKRVKTETNRRAKVFITRKTFTNSELCFLVFGGLPASQPLILKLILYVYFTYRKFVSHYFPPLVKTVLHNLPSNLLQRSLISWSVNFLPILLLSLIHISEPTRRTPI